jgi:hypothetical protein
MPRQLDQRGYGFIAGIVSFIFGAIMALLAFRLLFRLLGANPTNAFVDWIYHTSEAFVRPFFGIFNTDINVVTGGRFEVETLVAIVVYGVVGSLLLALFSRRTAV